MQNKYHFVWRAHFKDGSILNQIEGEQEKTYRDIDQHPEKVKKFELINVQNPEKIYSVDLETGDFNFNGVIFKNNIDVSDCQLRCIYFRRRQKIMFSAIPDIISAYLLGWQTTKNNINIKKEYIISPDCSIKEIIQKGKRLISSNIKIIK